MISKMPFVSTDGGKHEAGFKEYRDCAVRAHALFTGQPYAESHKLFASLGRRSGKGTRWGAIIEAMSKFRGNAERMTVAELVSRYPKGRVYAVVRGHAFAVIDGVIHDSIATSPRCKVQQHWVAPGTTRADSKSDVIVLTTTTSLNDRALPIFYRELEVTTSVYAIAKTIAAELNITLANALYYSRKFAKAMPAATK